MVEIAFLGSLIDWFIKIIGPHDELYLLVNGQMRLVSCATRATDWLFIPWWIGMGYAIYDMLFCTEWEDE